MTEAAEQHHLSELPGRQSNPVTFRDNLAFLTLILVSRKMGVNTYVVRLVLSEPRFRQAGGYVLISLNPREV